LFRSALILAALFLAAGIASRGFPLAAETARSIPPPVLDDPANPQTTSEIAVLAGGCFWGVQGVFQHLEGVTGAVSDYAGGASNTAHYEMVGTNTTGHAESVRITFDPRRISYGRILQIYFSVAHDPTQLNRPLVGRDHRFARLAAGGSRITPARTRLVSGSDGSYVGRADRRERTSPMPELASRKDIYFRAADFLGGTAFFRGAAFAVGGLSASLTTLPARNRTALLAAIWMASPVCGFRPSRAGRAATSKEPRPETRTASPATRASRMAFTTAFTVWPTAAWFSSVA
jgi:hypothetical protein